MMTETQYERWKLLSLGLARTFTSITSPRREKLVSAVEDCLDWIVCNGLETVSDWDHGIRYKSGGHVYIDEAAGERLDTYLWDHRYEFERQYRNGETELILGRFGEMLSMCVRAGFDVAISPSAGVIGFTVGDLRDACSGEMPDWVVSFFSDKAALLAAPRDEGVWL